MWIEYIGEIAILAVVLLMTAHFGLHLYFKNQKRKQKRKKRPLDAD